MVITDFIKIMLESISDNVWIFIALAVCVISLVSSVIWGRAVAKHFKNTKGKELKTTTYYWLDISYTVFVTTISMFPLFGMLGTVVSLIGLGTVFETTNDVSGIKSEFFLALTSTAWGIIFSLFFKFINALIQPALENQIEKAKEDLKM